MANPNVQRLGGAQPTVRLVPPPPLPQKFVDRFPELKDWNRQQTEWWNRVQDELARQIAIAQTK